MSLSRRQFFLASAAAFAPKRPNFIVLFTDDQRFDTVRALWGGETLTPNMDRLVRRGVAFTHACTQGGLTGAICMPSRAQLLTGRSVFRVHQGIVDRQARPDPEMVTFPEVLRRNGYQTFATGKWHNGPVLFQRSFESGDNIFFGGMGDHIDLPVQPYDASGKYPKERARAAGKFTSELFSDTAVRFLRERDKSKPFLLYVAYTSPHDPRMAPAKYADLFPPAKVKVPKNFIPQHPFDNGEMKVRDELLAGFPRTEEEVRKHIAAYYAMIAEVDAQIGRVLDAVDDDNTYVIFAGDNGLAVGQHGLMGKQNLYDHSLRVPLVISGPGVPKGRHAETLCHVMDLCPTIAELAGVSMPSVEGKSLAPVLRDLRMRVRSEVVAGYRGVQRAIRTDRYKLIVYNVDGKRTVQLFDLREDPQEMKNLAEKEPALVTRLMESLRRLLKDAGEAEVWV